MAERPVFVPALQGSQLVQEVAVSFKWHAGLAASQKKKNVVELHHAAEGRGLSPLLEISSKSDMKAGQRLSAFSLKIQIYGKPITVECAFQGSKVFEHGGPYEDIYEMTSRDAKRDPRLKESGRLISFRLEGRKYPLSPTTAFYDWLYFQALYPHAEWLERAQQFAGFTDIEFNPERSVNCQARSFAMFMALQQRGRLDEAMSSFDSFMAVMQVSSI